MSFGIFLANNTLSPQKDWSLKKHLFFLEILYYELLILFFSYMIRKTIKKSLKLSNA